MIGRDTELKALEQQYRQTGNQLVVLYGRNNIGKSELLQEFCKGKDVFFYVARQASPQLQRQMFGEEIQKKYNISIPEFSYDNFFKGLRSKDGSKKVIVIEDFDYIAAKDAEFVASIGKLKEKKLYPGPLMIVLCTSSVVWAEGDMNRCLESINKKITISYKVEELGFVDVVDFFPSYSVSETIRVYGVLGGVSGYLKKWDEKKGLKENICNHILKQDGFLHNEAQRYIGKELRELSVYNTILQAIASGRKKLNDLYLYTGFSRAKISVYMKNLMAFDVVEKATSFETGGWENAQKGLYQIKNTYIHFWYKFIYPHLSDLHLMDEEEFYDTYIAPGLEDYLNDYFKKVCMEYLELMSMINQLPIKIHKRGTWIGKQGNIDIIAQNSVRENIVGLCNWSEDKLTDEMFQQMLHSMELARIGAKKYYLFSAKDFDEIVKRRATEDENIVLIDMNRL